MPFRGPSRLCILFFGILLGLGGFGLYFFLDAPSGGRGPEARYYRAVYLLRSFGGPAAAEEESIPARVAYADETESLFHHPDKILVLRHVAEDLADLSPQIPRAALYEAYARLGLGERESAARLLMRYVVDAEYSPRHYALLCRILYEIRDYPSLLLMCREWSERDPECREDRDEYAFAAFYNLGRHADALRLARRQGHCLGGLAALYAAKALLAMGQEDQAEALLREALDPHSGQGEHLRRLWERLRDREIM